MQTMRYRVEVFSNLDHHLVQFTYSFTRIRLRVLYRCGNAFQFHRHQREPLAEVIVELSGEVLALLLLSVNQAATKFEALLFSLFAIGNIEHHAYHVKRLTDSIEVSLATCMYPTNAAVRPHCAQVNRVGQPLFEASPPMSHNVVAVVRM